MKFSFHNIVLPLLAFFFTVCLISCSEEDDVVKVDPTSGFTKIAEGYALGAGAKVQVWAEDELFAGLNNVYVALYDSISGKQLTESHIHLNPVMDMHTMTHSCPVRDPEEASVNSLFPAEILFTMPSGDMGSWLLEVGVHNHLNDQFGKAIFDIAVAATTPSKVVSFKTASDQRYYLAYVFPEKMKVGVNDFDLIAYTYVDGEFVPAENLSVVFSPEMPSMGHGSPNNVDPVYIADGHYAGKANFTMTGEWRLNLHLSDGDVDLGTKYFDVVVE